MVQRGEVRRLALHQNRRRELVGRWRRGAGCLLAVRRRRAVTGAGLRGVRLVRRGAVRLLLHGAVTAGRRIAGRGERAVIRRIRIGATARRYAVVRLQLRLVGLLNGGGRVQLMLSEHVMMGDQGGVMVLQAGRMMMILAGVGDVLHRRLQAVMVQVRVVHRLVLTVILLTGGAGHLMKVMHLLIVIVQVTVQVVQVVCLHLLTELCVKVALQVALLGLLLIGGAQHVMLQLGGLAGLQAVRVRRAQQLGLDVELSVRRVRTTGAGRRQLRGGRRRLAAIRGQQRWTFTLFRLQFGARTVRAAVRHSRHVRTAVITDARQARRLLVDALLSALQTEQNRLVNKKKLLVLLNLLEKN